VATLVVFTTAEDGDISDGSTVRKTATDVKSGSTSSTSASTVQGFWFMDTSSLTAGAVVTAATLTIEISSFEGLFMMGWQIDGSAGTLGSTLEAADWFPGGMTNIGSFDDSASLGSHTFTVPTAIINKTGYTNIHIYPLSMNATNGNYVHIDAYEQLKVKVDSVTTGTINHVSTNTLTYAHTVTGINTYLIVGVAATDSGSGSAIVPSTVKCNGVSMTQLTNGSNNQSMWGLKNPSSGNVVVTFADSNLKACVSGAISFMGVNQTNPVGTVFENTGSASPASVTVTGTDSNGMVVGNLWLDQSVAETATATGTSQWNLVTGSPGNDKLLGAGQTYSGTGGNVVVSWTLSGGADAWGVSGVCLNAATPATAAFLTITYTPAPPGGDTSFYRRPDEKFRYGWMRPISYCTSSMLSFPLRIQQWCEVLLRFGKSLVNLSLGK